MSSSIALNLNKLNKNLFIGMKIQKLRNYALVAVTTVFLAFAAPMTTSGTVFAYDAEGDDNVVSTAAQQAILVPICHRPPGNPENGKTLELPVPSAIAHLTHHPDDTLGPCGSPPEEVCDQPIVNRFFDTLYDITLDEDLGGVVVAGDELCLSGHVDALGRISPVGIQTAFDLTHPSSSPFGIAVIQLPVNGECGGTPPFVHAHVTSGNPTIDGAPLTQVCVRGA